MRLTVYVDVLFLINFLMDFFILWAASAAFKIRPRRFGIVVSSAVSAFLYCLMVVCLPYKNGIVIFFVFEALMVLAAYKWISFKNFIKNIVFVFVTSIAVGGICFWVKGMDQITLKVLLISAAITYLGIKFGINYIDRFFVNRQNFAEASIFMNNKEFYFTALIDTGFCTDKSIMIVEKSTVMEVEADIEIPFKSLGNNKGIIKGFKADSVVINGREINDVIIGLYDGKL